MNLRSTPYCGFKQRYVPKSNEFSIFGLFVTSLIYLAKGAKGPKGAKGHKGAEGAKWSKWPSFLPYNDVTKSPTMENALLLGTTCLWIQEGG